MVVGLHARQMSGVEASPKHEVAVVHERGSIEAVIDDLSTSYESLWPGNGLGEAYKYTLLEVVDDIKAELESCESDIYKKAVLLNGLAELKMVSIVEQLIFDSGNSFTDFSERIAGQDLFARIDGQKLGVKFYEVVEGELKEYVMYPRTVSWHVEANGIRSTVVYSNVNKSKGSAVDVGFDFHRRRDSRFGEEKQAAIDLHGSRMRAALNALSASSKDFVLATTGERVYPKKDYHRWKFLTEVVTSDDQFNKIKRAWLDNARSLLAKYRGNQQVERLH